MRIRSFLLLGVIGTSPAALAYSSGITSVSGKTAGTCSNCHTGGATPTVTLSGPTTVLPFSTNTYRLTLTGGAAQVGGLDVSVDSPAAALVAGPGLRAVAGEVTHASPQAFSNGALSLDFVLRAPSQEGKVTLYANGNSCNGDRGPMGDGSASTTLDVMVSAAPPPPAPDPVPPLPSPGTPPPTSGTTPGSGSTPAPGTPGGDPGSSAPIIEDPSGEPTGGCTAAGGALAPVLLLGWTAALIRRRRKARS